MQTGGKMSEIESTAIKNYKEFVAQLKKLAEDEQTAATLSFYKWCSKHRQEIHSVYVECIEDELAKFGLKPYKINHNMDCLVKFKNKAEAIIQIGVCDVNLLIYKL